MKPLLVSTAALAFLLAAAPLHAAKKVEAGAKPAAGSASASAGNGGWFDWRGPTQNSVSTEKGLPEKVDAKSALWTADFPGQSAPVIANGKLYIMGFEGDGPELQEGVACFDAETGKLLWKQLFNDFLSDVVYLRYANSSPAIDPETGNVYIQNSSGIFASFTADGKLLWKHSMMEEFGRMTFPNNRTASPCSTAISSSRAASPRPGARMARPAIASMRSIRRAANSSGPARLATARKTTRSRIRGSAITTACASFIPPQATAA